MNCRKGNWRTYRAAGLAPLLAKFEVGEGYAINESSRSPSFYTRAEHASVAVLYFGTVLSQGNRISATWLDLPAEPPSVNVYCACAQ